MQSRYFQSKRRGILPWVAGLILVLALACSSDNSHAEQARALLERIAALDPQAPLERRAGQLERLRELPLRHPDLVRARDACQKAHSGLLSAEAEQTLVRARLDRVGDGGLALDELADMRAMVTQAAERLHAARGALPECEDQTRALVARYR